MKLKKFLRKKSPKILKNLWRPLPLSLFFSAILLVAVYGKLFHPSKYLEHLDRWVSLVEAGLICALILLRNHFQVWLFMSLINAMWGGYAYFWHRLNLPCDCLGALVAIPTSFSLIVNTLFFVSSLSMAYTLGSSKKALLWTGLGACLTALTGFAFATWVYNGI